MREQLLTLADQTWRLHRWDTGHPDHTGDDAPFITVDWLTSRATKIRVYAPVLPVTHLASTPTPAIQIELVIAQTALQHLPSDPLPHHTGARHLAQLASQSQVRIRVLPDERGASIWAAPVASRSSPAAGTHPSPTKAAPPETSTSKDPPPAAS